MVVAFWSPFRGQAGVTANMMLTACGFSRLSAGRCLVMQPGCIGIRGETMVEDALEEDREERFGDNGMLMLLMGLKTLPLTRELFEDAVTRVGDDELYCLKGPEQPCDICEGTQNRTLLAGLPFVAEEYYDYVFCDLGAGTDEVSQRILERADVVVINVRQNRRMLESELPGEIRGKIFYLVGQYSSESRYTMSNLRRRYRLIGKNNSGAVPFCGCIGDAISSGRLAELMERYAQGDKDYGDQDYMSTVYDTVRKLYLFLEKKAI